MINAYQGLHPEPRAQHPITHKMLTKSVLTPFNFVII